jgi:hypothetical protein
MATPSKRKPKLKSADRQQVKTLVDQLHDVAVDAHDGRNAVWRVQNAIRGFAANEAFLVSNPELYDTS